MGRTRGQAPAELWSYTGPSAGRLIRLALPVLEGCDGARTD
jgi:hypothetical protein